MPLGLVGRNCSAEAMPFDGMVRQYLIIYIVNLLLLTKQVPAAHSTYNVLGVAQNTLHIIPATTANFSCSLGLQFSSTLACAWETSLTGSFFQHTLGLIRAVVGRKLYIQFLRAIPLSLTTPV
jgi:hypothetical protein